MRVGGVVVGSTAAVVDISKVGRVRNATKPKAEAFFC